MKNLNEYLQSKHIKANSVFDAFVDLINKCNNLSMDNLKHDIDKFKQTSSKTFYIYNINWMYSKTSYDMGNFKPIYPHAMYKWEQQDNGLYIGRWRDYFIIQDTLDNYNNKLLFEISYYVDGKNKYPQIVRLSKELYEFINNY